MAVGKRKVRTREQNVDFYKTGVRAQKQGESFKQYYDNLVDMANRRMRRLVEMEKDPVYKGVTNFAYKKAMFEIEEMTGKKMKGFSTVLPKNKDGSIDERSAHARLNAVIRFLESPTSTRGGINKMFKERVDSLNDHMGTHFTWQEMAVFWSSEKVQAEAKKYASATFVKAVYATKKLTKPEDIKRVLESNKQLSDDAIVDEIAKRLLKEGKTFSNLIG